MRLILWHPRSSGVGKAKARAQCTKWRAEDPVTKIQVSAGIVVLCAIVMCATSGIGYAQVVARQEVDKNGAPQYRVDPFWPKPLPNKWSMQQVVGIWVDQMDNVWFLNRGVAALPIELVAEGDPSPA